MQKKTFIPEWATVAAHLRDGLGYSETTPKRTRYTYNVFARNYCSTKQGNSVSIVRQSIEQAETAFELGEISKDKLLKMRRPAFWILQLIETGQIDWICAPLYGKIYGNSSNEALLSSYVEIERKKHRHAESIIKRNENIIRQYIRYAKENKISITHAMVQDILAFLSFMKNHRPAGLKNVASALKHFYIFLIDSGMAYANILLAIKPWIIPQKGCMEFFLL